MSYAEPDYWQELSEYCAEKRRAEEKRAAEEKRLAAEPAWLKEKRAKDKTEKDQREARYARQQRWDRFFDNVGLAFLLAILGLAALVLLGFAAASLSSFGLLVLFIILAVSLR